MAGWGSCNLSPRRIGATPQESAPRSKKDRDSSVDLIHTTSREPWQTGTDFGGSTLSPETNLPSDSGYS